MKYVMLLQVLKLIDFLSMYNYLIMGYFTLCLLVLGWLSKQTATVVSQETPVQIWVDEGMLFKEEYNTNLLRYLFNFCVTIANT